MLGDEGVNAEDEVIPRTNDEARSANTTSVDNRKSFFTSLSGNTELQLALFRFLSRDRDRRPSSFTQEDGEAEKGTLQMTCKLLLAFYRFVSGLTPRSEDNRSLSVRAPFTLASVAKDVEKNRTVVFQYLPHLITIYLCSQQRMQDKKQFKFIETFLLTLYNCEAWTGSKNYNTASATGGMSETTTTTK